MAEIDNLKALIREALAFEATAFENNTHIYGHDAIDFLGQWRKRAKLLVDAYDWNASDREASAIGTAALALPEDGIAGIEALEKRAEALGYADRAHSGGDGRTWEYDDTGIWFDNLNEAYDRGMTRWEEENA